MIDSPAAVAVVAVAAFIVAFLLLMRGPSQASINTVVIGLLAACVVVAVILA